MKLTLKERADRAKAYSANRRRAERLLEHYVTSMDSPIGRRLSNYVRTVVRPTVETHIRQGLLTDEELERYLDAV
jgi:hypothetical protein